MPQPTDFVAMKNRFFVVPAVAAVLALCAPALSAQESEIEEERREMTETSVSGLSISPLSLSVELSSRYIYRGLQYGDAPVGFATLGYGYKGFNAYILGAYAVNNSHQEVDLGVSYTYRWLTVGASDYYFPSAAGENDKYFDFDRHTTLHSVDAYVTVAPEKVPVWLTLSCYVFGNDRKADGKNAYSSYAELGYTYSFRQNNAISLAVGAALNRSFYNNYERGFSVVNIALKYATAFRFGSFRLPVSASYVLNPEKEKSYFTFSLFFNL